MQHANRVVPGLVAAALWCALAARDVGGQQAQADAKATADLPAGHSMHGEAFNEGPRQKAYLMGGTGKVRFPVTTKVPLAQEFFNQGVGQLHGFWYFEAERSFRQAAALDPDCAMAYWGMAMANVNNAKRAEGLIEKAAERKAGAGRREQLWIDGLAAYYKAEGGDDKARRRELVRGLERIVQEFPEDIEAKAFLAVQIWMNEGQGWPIPSHQAVDALLDQVFAAEPMHPAHHYRIHLWNYEKPERGLASAARSGQSAPTIAHMWHMGGHIFSQLQRYADAAWQQEASARVDHVHMMRDRVMPYQIHNYAHNNEWLTRDLMHVGRVHDAIDLAKNLIELPRHPQYNTLSMPYSAAQYGRTRLLEVLTQYELWDELIALSETVYLEPAENAQEEAKRLRALGAAHFYKGDVEAGKKQLAAMEGVLTVERDARQAAAEAAETKARRENQPDDKVLAAMSEAMKPFFDRLRPIERAISEVQGHAALAAGDSKSALEHFGKAADIRKEHLSRIHLQLGDKAKAEELGRQAVDQNKNQVYALANYVAVLHAIGKPKEAGEAFEQLRGLSAQIDLDVPVFGRLAPIAKELNLPADWRVPAATRDDVGQRPDLASLGPFRWQPSPAPDWSLPDAEGKSISLSHYRGRPVVVIFYLGYGCLHCVEQLKTFAPMTKDYADAGISLIAISSDSVADLKKSLQTSGQDSGFLFPLVSDQALDVFKAYRAFDDFENKPLHGTFLIDGEGLVRWQDISFQPFTDARFLLAESKRLRRQRVGLLAARVAGADPHGAAGNERPPAGK